MTRMEAAAVLRRALEEPVGTLQRSYVQAPRPHNPTRALVALVVIAAGWTAVAVTVVALILGWRP